MRSGRFGDAVDFIRRARLLGSDIRVQLYAAVAERLSAIYIEILPSEIYLLAKRTVGLLWTWPAVTPIAPYEVLHEWRSNDAAAVREKAILAVASLCDFFEYGVAELTDTSFESAALQFLRAPLEFLPFEDASVGVEDIGDSLSIVRGASDQRVPGRSEWLNGEVAFQECVLALAERLAESGDVLRRDDVHQRCWGRDPVPASKVVVLNT